MTSTVVTQLADPIGACQWSDGELQVHDADSFIDIQPADIPITIGHGGPVVGQVHYLEAGYHGGDLVAVGTLDNLGPEAVTGLVASPSMESRLRDEFVGERARLLGVALVGASARIGARPVQAYPGDFRITTVRSSTPWKSAPLVVERAAARAAPRHALRRERTIPIHHPDFEAESRESLGIPRRDQMGPIEFGPSTPIIGVR